MKIPQGNIQDNGNYNYQCPCYSKPCKWCFDGDETKIIQSLETAKGRQYYGNLKAYLALKGKTIISTSRSIKDENNGKFTMSNLLELCDRLKFPRSRIKIVIEYLEECNFIRHGTYERLKVSPDWRTVNKVNN